MINKTDYKWVHFFDDDCDDWLFETSGCGDVLQIGPRDFIITEECRIFTDVESYDCIVKDYVLSISE